MYKIGPRFSSHAHVAYIHIISRNSANDNHSFLRDTNTIINAQIPVFPHDALQSCLLQNYSFW